uniref:30S ribosomal protein S15 n=1 Tax=Timspurckia oligopyrenoides TaxID=708627 RepID=A0A7S0ZGR6_9RHOD|mmetsp:Transcript_4615/g.8060  ORF Transcript_4615/g.8060 Transcript_4615/m.8060 type:complete len:223 (+) Transcript_4615:69-737(+)
MSVGLGSFGSRMVKRLGILDRCARCSLGSDRSLFVNNATIASTRSNTGPIWSRFFSVEANERKDSKGYASRDENTGTLANSYLRLDGLSGETVKVPALVAAALSFENASSADLNKLNKRLSVEKFQRHENDTGSPEVQIAIMTNRIQVLDASLKRYWKDTTGHHRRMILREKRRKMAKYLLRESPERFIACLKALKLSSSVAHTSVPRKGSKKVPDSQIVFE